MKNWKIGLLALIAGAGMSGLVHAAELSIQYQELDKYRDLGRDVREREEVQKALSAHFKQLAEKHLPAGQTLKIDLKEFNRAGDLEVRRGFPDQMRVLREVSWPQMEFGYELLDGGRVLKSGKATLSEMGYLHSKSARYPDGDLLRYEKPMIDKWFDAEFGTKAAR